MAIDKALLTGSTTMLVLKLIEGGDKYGYQMIEELTRQSSDAFKLKAGTLYPILHGLEQQGMVVSYEKTAVNSKVRKYYSITKKGEKLLANKKAEWMTYTNAVNSVLEGGVSFARA